MPYQSRNELPSSVKDNLPEHAQDIYKEAFNNALKQYKSEKSRRGNASQEETASRVAWNAVKQQYEKGKDDKWHKK